jgi:hypothetical protein
MNGNVGRKEEEEEEKENTTSKTTETSREMEGDVDVYELEG